MRTNRSKLIESLGGHSRVFLKGREIAKDAIHSTLDQWYRQVCGTGWQEDDERRLVFIGESNLDFLLAAWFASKFGLKVILANRRTAGYVTERFRSSIGLVMSLSASPSHAPGRLTLCPCQPRPRETCGRLPAHLPERAAELVFCTSGTTSIQKLVLYQEAALHGNAEAVSGYLDLAGKSSLVFFPTNYMYGFSTAFATLAGGGTLYLEEPTLDIYQVFDYMKRVDVLPLIHHHVQLLKLAEANLRLDQVNPGLTVINASDKFYRDDLEFLFRFCGRFWNNYEQTESGPRILACPISREAYRQHPDRFLHGDIVALGTPVHRDIDIRLEPGQGGAASDPGLMHYRTPFRMSGYLEPDGTVAAMDEWQCSNDFITLNQAGSYCFVARKSSLVKEKGQLINLDLINDHFTARFIPIQACRAVFENGAIGMQIQVAAPAGREHPGLRRQLLAEMTTDYRRHFRGYPPLGPIQVVARLATTDTGKIALHPFAPAGQEHHAASLCNPH